jgi:DNA replication protein DnaC
MIEEQVKKISHELRLHGIHESFQRHADIAAAKSLHPNEFLKLVLDEEILFRRNKKAKALLSKAKFRTNVDLEDWDNSYDRGITKAQFRELAHLNFYHKKENLILVGTTGHGKSHLAISLGRQLCKNNISTIFLPVNFLFEEARAQRSAGKYVAYIKKMTKTEVILMDDFGLRNYTHDEANILVDLLEERYGKCLTILTSQVDPKGWRSLFEDPVIGDAIVDRLIHPATILTLQGGSYREKIKEKLPKGKIDVVSTGNLN